MGTAPWSGPIFMYAVVSNHVILSRDACPSTLPSGRPWTVGTGMARGHADLRRWRIDPDVRLDPSGQGW